MARVKLERLTLREKCRDAVQLSRDLIDHVDHIEIPKVHRAYRTLEKAEDSLTDRVVRELSLSILESEATTTQLYEHFENYLQSIVLEIEEILEGRQTADS